MKYPKKIKLPNGKFAKVQSEIEEKILLEEILKSEQLKQERDDARKEMKSSLDRLKNFGKEEREKNQRNKKERDEAEKKKTKQRMYNFCYNPDYCVLVRWPTWMI